MKVSEAKTKVCPFMSNYVANATDLTLGEVNCICGDCMAWVNTPTLPIKCLGLLMPTGKTETEHYCSSCYQKYLKANEDLVCSRILPTPKEEKEGYCSRLI